MTKGDKTMNPESSAMLVQLLPFVVLIAVFYFLIIRPQRKREKQTREMLSALKNGDNVTTIGGICGKIVGVKDDVITIEVGKDKVQLVFERSAIKAVEKPISD